MSVILLSYFPSTHILQNVYWKKTQYKQNFSYDLFVSFKYHNACAGMLFGVGHGGRGGFSLGIYYSLNSCNNIMNVSIRVGVHIFGPPTPSLLLSIWRAGGAISHYCSYCQYFYNTWAHFSISAVFYLSCKRHCLIFILSEGDLRHPHIHIILAFTTPTKPPFGGKTTGKITVRRSRKRKIT